VHRAHFSYGITSSDPRLLMAIYCGRFGVIGIQTWA
jgi:hypothetical protein